METPSDTMTKVVFQVGTIGFLKRFGERKRKTEKNAGKHITKVGEKDFRLILNRSDEITQSVKANL